MYWGDSVISRNVSQATLIPSRRMWLADERGIPGLSSSFWNWDHGQAVTTLLHLPVMFDTVIYS